MPPAGAAQYRTRVCHVVERLEYGGAEVLVQQLVSRMRDTRFAPIVCCLERGALGEAMAREGVTIVSLDLTRRTIATGPAFALFVARAVRRLRGVIDEHRIGLLHAHLPDPIVWASLAGSLHDTPVVGTYHGLGVLPVGRGALDPRNALRRRLYRWAARHSARTIAVSPQIRELLCGTLGFPRATTLTLTNGIDTGAFAGADGAAVRAELGLGARPVVTCVGRLIPGKGQAVLLDAFARIRQQHADALLLLVGDGPERGALEARAGAPDLRGVVSFARHRRDIPAVLAATQVFVLPSFAEGIPLSLLEAMAAGVPAVATAVPGNSNVIAHDGLGCLVPPRDPDAIATALTSLLNAPEHARSLGAAGQAHVRRHFDLGTMVRDTAALYDAVLAEHAARRGGAAA